MTAHMIPNLIYGALLLLVLLTPYASACLGQPARTYQASDGLMAIAILLGAAVLTILRLGGFAPFSLVLLVPLVGFGPRLMLGGIAAVLLFSPVTWWLPAPPVGPVTTLLFVLLALAGGFLPRVGVGDKDKDEGRHPALLLPMILCVMVGLTAGLLTAPFESAEPIYVAWHHWGAYLAPVEAWLSGGLPYRDFPVQYGLGPTSLLAATCGHDCWQALYATAIAANALYFATLAGGVMVLTARMPKGMRWLALAALFCACFLWTGFPINLAGPVMTPSVAGLRFLPISALLLHILVAERSGRPRDWIGHMLWLLDLFWSPEAAFFGTLIWWPYLAMRDAGEKATPREAIIALGRGGLRGLTALAVAGCALTLVLWFLSGKTGTPGDFFAYIQHPPGELPANPLGTAWIAVAAIASGVRFLAGRGLSAPARPLYACLLAVMAAGTYYLSRSHDNNILNLFPILILLLVAILSSGSRSDGTAPDFTRGLVQTMLAAMVAFVTTFNFWPWIEGTEHGGLFQLGPSRLIARFTPGPADSPRILSEQAIEGLAYLRGRGVVSPVLLDARAVMPWAPAGTGWTGVNNPANFSPLPDAMIAHYIRRGAAAYHRPGWILADDTRYRHWITLFRTAYDVRERKRFGSYSAYYLVPRGD